jgi:hypothetical protein
MFAGVALAEQIFEQVFGRAPQSGGPIGEIPGLGHREGGFTGANR